MSEVAKLLKEYMFHDYDEHNPEYNIVDLEIDGSLDGYAITINVYELYHDIELYVREGKIMGERITHDRCPECHVPKIKKDWIELKDLKQDEDIIKQLHTKLRVKTERY